MLLEAESYDISDRPDAKTMEAFGERSGEIELGSCMLDTWMADQG